MPECAYWRSTSLGNVLAQSPGETDGVCSTLVVLTPVDYSAISTNPFNLSVEQGTQIGLAVMAVWALAAGIRAIASVFNQPHDGD